MRAVKKARKLIVEDPNSVSAKILSGLILSLETDAVFSIGDIYQLDFDTFKLAIAILKDWRLDRYYSSKVKLYDASLEASKLSC